MTKKYLRTLLLSGMALASFMAVGLAPASAAEWVQGEVEGVKLSNPSPLTVTKETSSLACSWNGGSTTAEVFGGAAAFFRVENTSANKNPMTCNVPPHQLALELKEWFSVDDEEVGPGEFTVYFYGNDASLWSPWGYYCQRGDTATATFVNGSESTPSTIVFDNDLLGWYGIPLGCKGNVPILVSGTVEVTTPSGGLLTVKPEF